MDTNHIKQHLADLYAQAMLEELFGLQDELDRIDQELDDWAGKSLIDNGDEDECQVVWDNTDFGGDYLDWETLESECDEINWETVLDSLPDR